MPEFTPALPYPIKWAINTNQFKDSAEQFPKQLSVFIPLESLHAFAEHLINLADQTDKHRSSKVWDYANKAAVEVQGVYINANGKEGQDDSYFGNINPRKIEINAEDVF